MQLFPDYGPHEENTGPRKILDSGNVRLPYWIVPENPKPSAKLCMSAL